MSKLRPSLTRLVAFLAFLGSGCLSQQVSRDGVNVRQALLDMYTDQIMDNLIRAKTGLPFVQLSYSSLQIQDVDSVMGNIQNTNTVASDSTRTALNAVTGVVRHFTDALQLTGNAKRDRTMSLKADPITNQNDVYQLYMTFALDPNLFVCSNSKPACPVHIMRKWEKKYYWVPVEAASAFEALCLRTTFMRGPETVPPPVYWERTIATVYEYRRDPEDKDKKTPMVVYAALQLDQQLPNGDGSLIATLDDGRKIVLPVQQYAQRIKGDTKDLPSKGLPTTYLQATWSPAVTGFDVENLRNLPVKILLPEFPPPLPPATLDLKKINDNLDQINLNTLNLRNNSN
jgi:hypothetical protein